MYLNLKALIIVAIGMKKILKSTTICLFCLALLLIPSVHCNTTHRISWIPETCPVIVHLDYPAEAHRGETITYSVELKWNDDTFVNEVNVKSKYLREDGVWVWLTNTVVYNSTQVADGEEYSVPIEVEIPLDTKLHSFSMQVYLSIKTEKSPNTAYLDFITTNIVEKTRIELQNEINQLNKLTNESIVEEFNDYKQTHSYSNSEYDSLKSAYDHQCSENASVGTDDHVLIYILAAVSALFVATTVYFAKKASKQSVM